MVTFFQTCGFVIVMILSHFTISLVIFLIRFHHITFSFSEPKAYNPNIFSPYRPQRTSVVAK